MKLKLVGTIPKDKGHDMDNRVYSMRGGCPALPTYGHGKLTKVTRKYVETKRHNGSTRYRNDKPGV